MNLSEIRYVFWDGSINVDEQGKVNQDVTCKQYYLEAQSIPSKTVNVAPKSFVTLRQDIGRMGTVTDVSTKEDRTALSNLVIPTIKVRIEKVDEWFVPVTDLMAIQLKLRFVQNIKSMLLRIRECTKGEVGRVIYQEHFKKEQIEKLPTTDKSLNEPETKKKERKDQRKQLKEENKIASCLTHCTVEIWISSFWTEFDKWDGVTKGKELFSEGVTRAYGFCLHDRSVPKDEPWALYSPLREAKWTIKQYDQMAAKWKQRTEHKRNKHAPKLGKNQTLIGCELIEDIMNNETNLKVYDQEPADEIWDDKWFGNRKTGDHQTFSAFPALVRRTLYQICHYSPIGMALIEAIARDPKKNEVSLFPTKVIYPHVGGSGVNPAKKFRDDFDYEKRVHELIQKIKTKGKENNPTALDNDVNFLLNDAEEDSKEIREDKEVAEYLSAIKKYLQQMRDYEDQLKKYEDERARKQKEQEEAEKRKQEEQKDATAPKSLGDGEAAPPPPGPPPPFIPKGPPPPMVTKKPPLTKGMTATPSDADAPPEKPLLPKSPYDDRITFLVKRAVLRRIGAAAEGTGCQSHFYINLDYLKQQFEDREYACRYHFDGAVLPFQYSGIEYEAVEARMGLNKGTEVHIETPFFLAFLHEMIHARRFQIGSNAEYDIFPRSSPADSKAVPWHPDSFLQALIDAGIGAAGTTGADAIDLESVFNELNTDGESPRQDPLFPAQVREKLEKASLDSFILGKKGGTISSTKSGPSIPKAFYAEMSAEHQFLLKKLPCENDAEKERYTNVGKQLYEHYTGTKSAVKVPDIIPNLVSRYTDEKSVYNREEFDTIEGAGVQLELSEVLAKHAEDKGIRFNNKEKTKVRLTENLFRQELGLPLRRRYTDGKTNLDQQMEEGQVAEAEARFYIKPGTRATKPEKLETPDISTKHLKSAEAITNELLNELGIKDKQAVLMERDKNFFLTDPDHFAIAYQASSIIKQPDGEDSKNWCSGKSVGASDEKQIAFLDEMAAGRDQLQRELGAAAATLVTAIDSTEPDYYPKAIEMLKSLYAMQQPAIASVRSHSGKLQDSWGKASGYDAFAGFLMNANIAASTGRTVDPSLALKADRAAYLPEKFRNVEVGKILHTLIHEPIHLMSYWCAGFDKWDTKISSKQGECYDVVVNGVVDDPDKVESLLGQVNSTVNLKLRETSKGRSFSSKELNAACRDLKEARIGNDEGRKNEAKIEFDRARASFGAVSRVAFQQVLEVEATQLRDYLNKTEGALKVELQPKPIGAFFVNQLFDVDEVNAIRSVLNEGATELFTRIISWRLNQQLKEEAVRITTVCGFGSYEFPMHLVCQIVRDLNDSGLKGLSLLANAYFYGNWIDLNDAFENMRESGKFQGRYTPGFWGAVQNLGISNDHHIGLEKNQQAILDLRDTFGLPWRLPNELVDDLNHGQYHDPVCCRYIYLKDSPTYEHQPLVENLKAICCTKYDNQSSNVPVNPQPLPFKCPLCEGHVVVPGEHILKNGKPKQQPVTQAPKPRSNDPSPPPQSSSKPSASASSQEQEKKTPKDVIGITNAGSSCYLNASLQLLFHSRFVTDPCDVPVPVLKPFFQEYDATRKEGITVAKSSVQPIREKLKAENIITDLFREDDPAPALEYFLEKLGYRFNVQVSRVYVLDKRVPDEGKPKTGQQGDTDVDEKGRQQNVESDCLVRIEPKPGCSLQEAWLSSWNRGKDSMDSLPRANVKGQLFLNLEGVSERREWSGAPPARVIVQLKRFAYIDRTFAGKIEYPVEVAATLTIQETVYQLRGIIQHIGDKPTEGHYIAFVKGRDTHDWFCANDTEVRKSDEKEALQAAQTAYLFYFEKA